MTDAITKGERTELRSIVRQQFRVLRSELDQREAEMESEIEQRLLVRYHDEDKALRTLATGALESESARAFLGAIPTIGELVPASRLAELEAQFTVAEGES